MVGIYFATVFIYRILKRVIYFEKFNRVLTSYRSKTMQLVQFCLTKIDKAQHMGLIIASD